MAAKPAQQAIARSCRGSAALSRGQTVEGCFSIELQTLAHPPTISHNLVRAPQYILASREPRCQGAQSILWLSVVAPWTLAVATLQLCEVETSQRTGRAF